eukprot:Gb_06582 [translate_table: standard]
MLYSGVEYSDCNITGKLELCGGGRWHLLWRICLFDIEAWRELQMVEFELGRGGSLWPQLICSPPPPPYYYKSPPPPYYHPAELKVVVVGKVYCYKCWEWSNPKSSHNKKHLEGATVAVTCKAGEYKTITAYGVTKSNGKFKIIVDGYDYEKWGGAQSCKAKLYKAPSHSTCSEPTNLHGGKTGALLQVKSKSDEEISPPPPSPSHPPPYYYKSPPPPSHSSPPPYYYKSPPPPSPSPPSAYNYISPPPPPVY